MPKRLILLCFLVIALFFQRAVSQKVGALTHGWEYSLLDFYSTLFSDSIQCGDYFIILEEENGCYIYCLPEARNMADDTMIVFGFLYGKCRVYLNKNKNAPTIQPFYSRDGKIDSILIRISEKEYEEAGCLPEPQKKRTNAKPSKDTASENKKKYCYVD